MPIETVIDREIGIIARTVTGKFTFQEVKVAFEELLRHPHLEEDMRSIWDFRTAESLNPQEQDIIKMAKYFLNSPDIPEVPKVAFVVSHDLAYGISRMFEAHAIHVPVKFEIFRNYDDAMKWVMK
jgi:hypothetical protein